MSLLEKCYEKEIDGALNKHPGIYQTKSAVAEKLVESGHLMRVTDAVGGPGPRATISGYRLTILGNATYCLSCT
jgi:hypothetical protein